MSLNRDSGAPAQGGGSEALGAEAARDLLVHDTMNREPKPVRVAVVVPELLPVPATRGGAIEHWVETFLRRMAGTSALDFVSVSRPAGTEGIPGVRHRDVPWTALDRLCEAVKSRTTWKNPLRAVVKILNVWNYGRRAARLVEDVDAVHLHNEPNLLLFLRRLPGRRVVLHMHNDHLLSRAFRPLYRRLLHRADAVLCVSEYIRGGAAKAFPEHAHRFHVVLNATDGELFRPYPREQALESLQGILPPGGQGQDILFAGRVSPLKGVHVLIEAFGEVLRTHPQARLIIAGSSFFGDAPATPYEKEVARLAAGIGGRIVFTGFLPHERLRHLYSACDVVALPSTWNDPCPLAVLEAMASGACVVSTRAGGIPELIESGTDGFLVRPGSVPELAQALVSLLGDAQLRSRAGQAARRSVVERFTWERLLAQIAPHLSGAA